MNNENFLGIFSDEEPQIMTLPECFALSNPSRLDKMVYLIHGADKKSILLANNIRNLHSFYNTHILDLDLCSKPRNSVDLNAFIEHLNVAFLQGSGLLIADERYYTFLIDKFPILARKMGLIRPDFDEDYIQKMVIHQAPEHYAMHIKALKDKENNQGTSYDYYRKDFQKYDYIVLRGYDVESWVYAAYIYHEMNLLYGHSPYFIFLKGQYNSYIPQYCLDFFQTLGVKYIQPPFSSLTEILNKGNALFIEARHRSAETCYSMKLFMSFFRLKGNFSIYSFDKPIDENNKASLKEKSEKLSEKHQDYIKKLFDL